ncbi:putative actinidain [Medicago truncatula]|uniref:Cathepsin propeptide inhibitor domain protein n=1 Tax=Medicago truncatula TaxID=3880 RepID=G7I5Q2_MEDTR|nr:cathepsin propeptide inhibitor domain protein [Medicago truncatula]RHN76806.1 putative actinidain [Medicago truncatula]
MKLVTVFMLIIVLLACSYHAAMSRTLSKKSSSSVDEAFQQWMLKYNRTYSSITEMKRRKEIFKMELELIEKHNSTAAGFTIGLNEFSDRTIEEFCDCSKVPPMDDFLITLKQWKENRRQNRSQSLIHGRRFSTQLILDRRS